MIPIGDEIFAKAGGFLLGNFLTSVVAGLGTYLWMLASALPYPILLGLFVAFMDLIPVGALVAIPAAAALRLLLEEVAFHRLDAS